MKPLSKIAPNEFGKCNVNLITHQTRRPFDMAFILVKRNASPSMARAVHPVTITDGTSRLHFFRAMI